MKTGDPASPPVSVSGSVKANEHQAASSSAEITARKVTPRAPSVVMLFVVVE